MVEQLTVAQNNPISGRYCALFTVPDNCASNEFHLYIQTVYLTEALSCDLEIYSGIDDTMDFSLDYKEFTSKGYVMKRDFTMSYCKGTKVVVAARYNIFNKVKVAYEV